MSELHYQPSRLLKLQVGHLLAESGGVRRDTTFEIPVLKVADDLTVDYLRGTLHLTRNTRGILVQGTLDTRVQTECGRCLDDTRVPLTLEFEELFVSPATPDAEFVIPETGVMDLAPLIREEVLLGVSTGVLCGEDCKGLCTNCGQNFNHGTCHCADQVIDPRFAALYDLQKEMKNTPKQVRNKAR